MRNGLMLTFTRRYPHRPNYSSHYRDPKITERASLWRWHTPNHFPFFKFAFNEFVFLTNPENIWTAFEIWTVCLKNTNVKRLVHDVHVHTRRNLPNAQKWCADCRRVELNILVLGNCSVSKLRPQLLWVLLNIIIVIVCPLQLSQSSSHTQTHTTIIHI